MLARCPAPSIRAASATALSAPSASASLRVSADGMLGRDRLSERPPSVNVSFGAGSHDDRGQGPEPPQPLERLSSLTDMNRCLPGGSSSRISSMLVAGSLPAIAASFAIARRMRAAAGPPRSVISLRPRSSSWHRGAMSCARCLHARRGRRSSRLRSSPSLRRWRRDARGNRPASGAKASGKSGSSDGPARVEPRLVASRRSRGRPPGTVRTVRATAGAPAAMRRCFGISRMSGSLPRATACPMDPFAMRSCARWWQTFLSVACMRVLTSPWWCRASSRHTPLRRRSRSRCRSRDRSCRTSRLRSGCPPGCRSHR